MKQQRYTILAKQFSDGTVQAGPVICGIGHCPAVMTTPEGKAIVVGRLLSKAEHAAISGEGIIAFHEGEFAVEVSPELLRKAATKL